MWQEYYNSAEQEFWEGPAHAGPSSRGSRAVFVTNCVGSTAREITPMVDAAKDITRRTFRKHVDTQELLGIELSLGYAHHPKRGLTMAGDWSVSYHKSTFKGRPCWFFRWSAIEYVFVEVA